MTNVQIEAGKKIAAMAGFTNWIIAGSAESGWYTCIITGKKMRSKQAEEQLAKQTAYMASSIPSNYESTVVVDEAEEVGEATSEQPASTNTPDNGASPTKAKEEGAINWRKVDVTGMNEEMEQEFLAHGIEHISKAQWDAYCQSRDEMSAKLRDHLETHTTFTEAGMKQPKMTKINCADCGTERIIKVQDAFQVTRCVPCQHKHRMKVRAMKRKAKAEAKKQSN